VNETYPACIPDSISALCNCNTFGQVGATDELHLAFDSEQVEQELIDCSDSDHEAVDQEASVVLSPLVEMRRYTIIFRPLQR